MAYPQFVDVSSYQRDDPGFFSWLKSKGIKGVVVKVTEGDASGSNYINPKWVNQANNAIKAGLQVGVYHFARWSSPQNAITEADFFLRQVLPFGFDQSTVLAVDCETNEYGLNAGTYQACVNAWLNEVRKHFHKTAVYANVYWFTHIINSHAIGNAIPWVAGYDVDSLGINNAGAWQWDDGKRSGLGVDVSYDFNGAFTSAINPQPVVTQPNPPQTPEKEKIIKLAKGETLKIEGV